MSLNDFKDWLFNLLNEVDADMLADIETKDKLNTFQLRMADGSVFEIECREAQGVYGKKQQKTNSVRKDRPIIPHNPADQI